MAGDLYIVDTHIFILLFNDRLAASLPHGKMGCSIITEMELRSFPKLTVEEESFFREKLTGHTIYKIDDAIKEKAILLRRNT